MNHDNSWFSDRTKTIMVTVVMTALIVGMAWGYYEAYQWRQERRDQAEQIEHILNSESEQ